MKVAILTDLPHFYNDTSYLSKLEQNTQDVGITTHVFLIKNSKKFEKFDLKTGFFKFLQVSNLVKKLSKYDLIHVQFTFPLGLSCAVLSCLKKLKKPFIIHTHGNDVFFDSEINYGVRRQYIGKKITNYSWNQANRIITVCKKAKQVIENEGISSQKLSLLYNGIDETQFKKSDNALPTEYQNIRQKSDIIFLNVASPFPVKNHNRMISAFEKVAKKNLNYKKITLISVGGKIPVNSTIENLDIQYIGNKNRSELIQLYNLADAFILPSVSEAHPWSLLEAMSCELPILASNVGGIPETISKENFLFQPKDVNDMIKKIENFLELDDSQRKNEGIQNRKLILENFTLRKHIENLKKIYEVVFSS